MVTDSGAPWASPWPKHAGALPEGTVAGARRRGGGGGGRRRRPRRSPTPTGRAAADGASRVPDLHLGIHGRPKGVVVTHAGLAELRRGAVCPVRVAPDSRTLHFASPSFDASMLELLMAVGAAATMVIAPTAVYGGDELARTAGGTEGHACIRHARRAGDGRSARAWPTARHCCRRRGVLDRPGRALGAGSDGVQHVRSGGGDDPDQDASDPLVAGASVTIGGPIRGVGETVLDGRLRPVPVGVAGEL